MHVIITFKNIVYVYPDILIGTLLGIIIATIILGNYNKLLLFFYIKRYEPSNEYSIVDYNKIITLEFYRNINIHSFNEKNIQKPVILGSSKVHRIYDDYFKYFYAAVMGMLTWALTVVLFADPKYITFLLPSTGIIFEVIIAYIGTFISPMAYFTLVYAFKKDPFYLFILSSLAVVLSPFVMRLPITSALYGNVYERFYYGIALAALNIIIYFTIKKRRMLKISIAFGLFSYFAWFFIFLYNFFTFIF
ncbi:hypothetical protein [Picrophilus oshimae]|uniref:Hypothetical membrane spanning protein n=1 Tax=Picrophilus torridus (strain ATCC 700027 / DSM 9790 / JCM 10055 / NBRC 100828 / KAW 2/3) TaxID=1122961 RepID=Q6L2U1_PICTO|nr:hypothetical protein [Picrophilus oshimae]AAT42711.1 hypothetical membrane spanning protein [Picrophilus oshimae DSM 9789]